MTYLLDPPTSRFSGWMTDDPYISDGLFREPPTGPIPSIVRLHGAGPRSELRRVVHSRRDQITTLNSEVTELNSAMANATAMRKKDNMCFAHFCVCVCFPASHVFLFVQLTIVIC